jgi:hypothetical protein
MLNSITEKIGKKLRDAGAVTIDGFAYRRP